MADKNVSSHITKALAGHSSLHGTEKYITPNVDAKKEAARKIGLHFATKPAKEKGENDGQKNP
jgi:hypothetical protein